MSITYPNPFQAIFFYYLYKQVATITSCILCTLLWQVPSVLAQMRVAPLVIEANANRGQAQGVIQVTNSGNVAVDVEVYASPFTYDESGFVELESGPHDLTPYLFFSPRKLSIEPGQARRIRLAVRLLPSLQDGEYRAVVFTQSQQAITEDISGVPVSIIPRIGVLFFVRKGSTSPDLVVQSVDVGESGQQVELLINNQGTASIRPGIQWRLSQNNNEIASGETPRTVLLAGESRPVGISVDDRLQPGSYQLQGKIIEDNLSTIFEFDIVVP